MGCACATSYSTNMARRYMRVDGLIFDKKYISSLNFDGDILTIYRKGNCHAFKYKMSSAKSPAQIAKYLVELNTCGDTQVDMTTDDHSKLINLDVAVHPVSAIVGLDEELNNKQPVIEEVEVLPNASENKFKIIYSNNSLLFSDGTSWKKIVLEDL